MSGSIERIGIAGAGIMGGGIAQMFAEHGREVRLWDVQPKALQGAVDTIGGRLRASAGKGRIQAAQVEPILGRIRPVGSLEELAACDLLLEAIPEDLSAKRRLLARLSALAPAVIGSNTSSLSIRTLARTVRSPERFLGIHFFNPPTKLELVEMVPSARTAPEPLGAVRQLLIACGKTPIVVKDCPGFIVNRLLLLMINEAARMLDEGVASAEDIDTAMRLGALHPAGPLATADLIGLDTCWRILKTLQRSLRSGAYRPAVGLKKRVQEGKLGRKSGEGFHGGKL